MDNFNAPVNNQPKKFSVPKIIFIILGVALVAEVIYAGWSLFPKSAGSPLPVTSNVEQSVARISLTASKQSFQLGEIIPVLVTIDSGSKTISGVDLIVQYDPAILEVAKEDLTPGQIMDEYPLRSVDQEQGLISISGISNLGNSFSGVGEFATINLRAKSAGETTLTIKFEKDTTVASNLVEASTSGNILEEVDNLDLLIE